MADNQQNPGLLANILAVAGFFILIIIIVWGAYHLLRLTGSGVSSLFSRFSGSSDTIELTLPSTPVTSGKTFNLSWKYTPKEDGTYAFLYQCQNGLKMEAQTPSRTKVAVPCGNAFTVGNSTSIELIPNMSGTGNVNVPLTVLFMPAASSSTNKPQGAGMLVVAGSGTQTNGTKTTQNSGGTKTSTSGTNAVAHASGPADIAVTMMGTGVIDASGNFVERQPMNPNEIAAVKFDIANKGGVSTGSYYFTVQLPMSPTYTYTSPLQAALEPGAHVVNILRYRPLASGGGTVSVLADSTFTVAESNETNNVVTQWTAGPTWNNYNYQYNQPYVY